MKWFKTRHPQFTTNCTRIRNRAGQWLYPTNVLTFYQNLETIYTTNGYALVYIWNVDESGARSGKVGDNVLARKDQRHVQTIILNNIKSLTVLSTINASGKIIPNFYIFEGW